MTRKRCLIFPSHFNLLCFAFSTWTHWALLLMWEKQKERVKKIIRIAWAKEVLIPLTPKCRFSLTSVNGNFCERSFLILFFWLCRMSPRLLPIGEFPNAWMITQAVNWKFLSLWQLTLPLNRWGEWEGNSFWWAINEWTHI